MSTQPDDLLAANWGPPSQEEHDRAEREFVQRELSRAEMVEVHKVDLWHETFDHVLMSLQRIIRDIESQRPNAEMSHVATAADVVSTINWGVANAPLRQLVKFAQEADDARAERRRLTDTNDHDHDEDAKCLHCERPARPGYLLCFVCGQVPPGAQS